MIPNEGTKGMLMIIDKTERRITLFPIFKWNHRYRG